MIRVQVRPNETLEAALRRFKRQCNYAGVFRLAKKYAYHEKRSDKRRREERERIRNIQRALRKSKLKTKVRSVKRGKPKGRPDSEDSVSAVDAVTTPLGFAPAAPAARPAAPYTAAGSGGRMAVDRTPATGAPHAVPRAAMEPLSVAAKVDGASAEAGEV